MFSFFSHSRMPFFRLIDQKFLGLVQERYGACIKEQQSILFGRGRFREELIGSPGMRKYRHWEFPSLARRTRVAFHFPTIKLPVFRYVSFGSDEFFTSDASSPLMQAQQIIQYLSCGQDKAFFTIASYFNQRRLICKTFFTVQTYKLFGARRPTLRMSSFLLFTISRSFYAFLTNSSRTLHDIYQQSLQSDT
jgi:hypothetical protein